MFVDDRIGDNCGTPVATPRGKQNRQFCACPSIHTHDGHMSDACAHGQESRIGHCHAVFEDDIQSVSTAADAPTVELVTTNSEVEPNSYVDEQTTNAGVLRAKLGGGMAPPPSRSQLSQLRTSNLAAGIIANLLSRCAHARHTFLECRGGLGVFHLLKSASTSVQLHGIAALGAFTADNTQAKLAACNAAFPGINLIAHLSSIVREWAVKQGNSTSVFMEVESTSAVLLGLDLLQCALTAAVQAKLACSDPDERFAVMAELMHLAYWCMSQGPAANHALMVSLYAILLGSQPRGFRPTPHCIYVCRSA